MKKGLFWGGIACLALAVVLGILTLVLPPGSVGMVVEDRSIPWFPVVAAAIAGIALLISSRGARRGTTTAAAQREVVLDPEKAKLNKRLETIGWGCFLIMLGGFALVPETAIAKGFWSIGVGIIMLGLNAARYFYHIKMSGFTTFLGILSLIGGVLQLVGLEEIGGAFLLIILGLFLLVRPWFDRRRLFGKAEEA